LGLIHEKGHAVEVNTSGLDHPVGEIYPSQRLLVACRKKGIPVTLGSDAHRPESVGGHRKAGLAAIRQAGYQTLTGFTRRIPCTIDINLNLGNESRKGRFETLDSSTPQAPTSHA
jgi:histidinol-phosphatase (PHP family)